MPAVIWLLRMTLAASGLALAVRTLLGPFHWIFPVKSPINAESIFAASLAACLILSSTRQVPAQRKARQQTIWILAIAFLSVLCFTRALPFYFLSDDFELLRHAWGATLAHVPIAFTRSGDGFFRPLGHITLWPLWSWYGLNPVGWHLPSLIVHSGTAVLVYLFALRLYPERRIAIWAAALFAVHGSHPETVTWVASWFGVLATFFSMAALLLFVEYRKRARWLTLMGSLACLIAALISKESAYVFPLLALVVAGRPWRRAFRWTLPYWVVTILVWFYRVWVVGGIGGYRVAGTAAPQVIHVTLIGTLKALGLRLWSTLFFPVNWSVEPEAYLMAAMLIGMAALLVLSSARLQRCHIIVPLALIVIPVLPVVHLLSIGSDLLNSRAVYISTIGFSLLIAAAIESFEPAWLRPWIAGAILVFQVAALQHNLTIRGRVAEEARRACEVATQVAANSGSVTVAGLPGILDGVYFFSNGFQSCVELHAQKPVDVFKNDSAGAGALVWDPQQRELKVR